MKIILLLLMTVPCFGQYKSEVGLQAKIDSVKDSHAKQTEILKAQRANQYEKFVKVSVNDMNILLKGIDRLKKLEMYNPSSTDKEKIENYKFLETFVTELRSRLKIDSVKRNFDVKN